MNRNVINILLLIAVVVACSDAIVALDEVFMTIQGLAFYIWAPLVLGASGIGMAWFVISAPWPWVITILIVTIGHIAFYGPYLFKRGYPTHEDIMIVLLALAWLAIGLLLGISLRARVVISAVRNW